MYRAFDVLDTLVLNIIILYTMILNFNNAHEYKQTVGCLSMLASTVVILEAVRKHVMLYGLSSKRRVRLGLEHAPSPHIY